MPENTQKKEYKEFKSQRKGHCAGNDAFWIRHGFYSYKLIADLIIYRSCINEPSINISSWIQSVCVSSQSSLRKLAINGCLGRGNHLFSGVTTDNLPICK